MSRLITRRKFKELEKEREGKLFEVTFRSVVPEKFLIINTVTGEQFTPTVNKQHEIFFKPILRGTSKSPVFNVELGLHERISMLVYMSTDNGALYSEDEIRQICPDEDEYIKYEVPETITLSAQQILGCYGSLVEILFRAGQIKKL